MQDSIHWSFNHLKLALQEFKKQCLNSDNAALFHRLLNVTLKELHIKKIPLKYAKSPYIFLFKGFAELITSDNNVDVLSHTKEFFQIRFGLKKSKRYDVDITHITMNNVNTLSDIILDALIQDEETKNICSMVYNSLSKNPHKIEKNLLSFF